MSMQDGKDKKEKSMAKAPAKPAAKVEKKDTKSPATKAKVKDKKVEVAEGTTNGSGIRAKGDTKKIDPTQKAAMQNAMTLPSLNQSSGSAYLGWRLGIALAGAPDYPTEPAGAFAGDPLLATYSDADLDIINSAAKMVGAGEVKKLTDNRSTEADHVQKASPIKGFKGYK